MEYAGKYTALYPIKVNQQEAVVENIIATQNVSIGRGRLQAGADGVLALAPKGGTIVCNGYKDREFIRLALMGQKLGHKVFIVIEKESEVGLVIEEANELKLTPQVGLRVRCRRWHRPSGPIPVASVPSSACPQRSCSVIERFRAAEMDQGIRLLHFHMGSQIANRRITVRASVRLSVTTPSYGR